jgi:hypothetical protein
MSQYLNKASIIEFDTEAKHAYQTTSATLSGTTTERKGVVGSEYKFAKMGKGQATERTAPSADAIPMNVDHGKISCILKDWSADEFTDIFEQAATNIDEVKELAVVIAGALGRRDDQIKINAMAAGTFNATPVQGTSGGLVGTNVGGTTSNLNVVKLRKIKKYMDDNEVPAEGRHISISPSGLEGLLGETQVTSSDYSNVKALVNGDVDTFLGYKFHMIGIRKEGGLSKTGALRDGYAWHESAIGYANGIDMTTSVDWIPIKKSYLSSGNLRAQAVIRDIDGIVKYQATEA